VSLADVPSAEADENGIPAGWTPVPNTELVILRSTATKNLLLHRSGDNVPNPAKHQIVHLF
jgi:hypothetical protein